MYTELNSLKSFVPYVGPGFAGASAHLLLQQAQFSYLGFLCQYSDWYGGVLVFQMATEEEGTNEQK